MLIWRVSIVLITLLVVIGHTWLLVLTITLPRSSSYLSISMKQLDYICLVELCINAFLSNQVWDYQTKSCVQTLEGHTHNVSAVCFHPELPIIITGSEDGTVRIWHATTYRLVLSYICLCTAVWIHVCEIFDFCNLAIDVPVRWSNHHFEFL